MRVVRLIKSLQRTRPKTMMMDVMRDQILWMRFLRLARILDWMATTEGTGWRVGIVCCVDTGAMALFTHDEAENFRRLHSVT